ncbi:MAG: hypothetical protein KDD55_01370, partial [Bdellovibrionales bacterium]|nr:hypothetical protein [Bdellovibrionales bacterium]
MSPRLLKYLFALLLIGLLVWWVDFRSLWESLSQLTLFLAGYLLLISVLLIYISALKWKLFVESYGKDASLGYL